MSISLIPLDGGKPFVVQLPITVVGRKEGCDFRLEGEGVVDMQCVLALSEDILLIRDLDTDNIRVNGQRVRRACLLPNDQLTIASCTFRVQYEKDPA
jgi:hypothetical protein